MWNVIYVDMHVVLGLLLCHDAVIILTKFINPCLDFKSMLLVAQFISVNIVKIFHVKPG